MGLAEARKKQRIGADPQNKNWAGDKSGFGFKMLQKMGWKEGSGLGANLDGCTEHVKVSLKTDVGGLGASKRDMVEDTYGHTKGFDEMLKNLASKDETSSKKEKKEKKSSSKKDKKEKDDKKEKKSKKSKVETVASVQKIHRRKFIQNKDVSSYSEKQLKEIFGVCSAIADAERQENETARAETPFTSMSDPLEALRLQVLKSVKPKGPDQHSDNVTIQVQREDGEISESSQRMSPLLKPPAQIPAARPFVDKRLKQTKKAAGKKKNKQQKAKTGFPKFHSSGSSKSSALFQNSHYKAPPPPPPSSFGYFPPKPNLPAASYKWVNPNLSKNHAPVDKPSFVIELDTTDDESVHESEKFDSKISAHVPEADETKPIIAIIPDDNLQLQTFEKTVETIRSQLQAVEKSFAENELTVSDAVTKQNELKQKLKSYKELINKGKLIKTELTSRKNVLLMQLLTVKKNIEMLKGSTSSPANSVEMTPESTDIDKLSEIINDLALKTSDTEDPTAEENDYQIVNTSNNAREKRKIEMIELENQIEKVKKDLEKSKVDLLTSKRRKLEKKKNVKSSLMVKGFVKLLNESRATPLTAPKIDRGANFGLGNQLVPMDGGLIPIGIIETIWSSLNHFSKSFSGKGNSEASHDFKQTTLLPGAYDSPLRWFRSSVFCDQFLDFVAKKGILSPSYQSKIDPNIIFCKDEFEFGCTNKTCKFQHFKQITPSNDSIMENIINRLLDYTPKDQFKSKQDILLYIHEKMSGMKGVPVVTMISKLLSLRKDIAEETHAIHGIASAAMDLDQTMKKQDAAELKTFVASAKNISGRFFYELTAEIRSGSLGSKPRYYFSEDDGDQEEASSESLDMLLESLPNTFTSHEDKTKALEQLKMACNANKNDQKIQLFSIDLLSSLGLDTAELLLADRDSKVDWLEFYLSSSFSVRCHLASKLLPLCTESCDLYELIMALAKAAIDFRHADEVHCIFSAVLNSHMSLKNQDDGVPSAQLCSLSTSLDLAHRVKLWLFYSEYINTGSYNSRWFHSYPFDSCPVGEFYPILSWNSSLDLTLFKTTIHKFLQDENLDAVTRDLLSVNLLALELAGDVDPLTSIETSSLSPLCREVLEFFCFPDPELSASSIGLLVRVAKLLKDGLEDQAREALGSKEFGEAGSQTEADCILSIFRKASSGVHVGDELSSGVGRLFDIGRGMIYGVPIFCRSLEDYSVLKHLNLDGIDDRMMLKSIPKTCVWSKPPTSIDEYTEILLLNPADRALWIGLIKMTEAKGLDGFVPELEETARRFCNLYNPLHLPHGFIMVQPFCY